MNVFKRIFSIKGSGLFAGFFATLLICISISGCGLFRKKNKCGECPKWSVSENHSNTPKMSGDWLINKLPDY